MVLIKAPFTDCEHHPHLLVGEIEASSGFFFCLLLFFSLSKPALELGDSESGSTSELTLFSKLFCSEVLRAGRQCLSTEEQPCVWKKE